MADYYSVMLGAIRNLDPNTVETRRNTYNRARQAMLDRLQSVEPRLPKPVIDAELGALNEAIERVEAQYGGGLDSVGGGPRKRIAVPVIAALSAIGVVIVAALGVMVFGPRLSREEQAKRVEPASSGVSYVYLRQPVYYRTTHPAGTILIDKAQRFIYIVLPNVVALRYGIGVGPECATAAGLYRISRKEEWPGRSDSTFGQLRNLIGGDRADNPLGPRALYFGTDYRLHGTNAPRGIGGTLPVGCFALLNESITEFYDKAPVETRIVVMD
jgi:lipoprotein-anchoring transpeptidase ErfK/SrfK